MIFKVQSSKFKVQSARGKFKFELCTLNFELFLAALFAFTLFLSPAIFAADRPDLVVVVSIDQFRYEYLQRFEPYFAPDGFRRFIDHGADFTNAYYPYATTYTGPGHAAIGTGYTPSQSGIVGNDWFDRNTGKTVYCVADARTTGGYSPVNLQSDSLGDRLQERFPGSRVFGVAIKDRAAILMSGRKATAAYWFDEKKNGFTSSSYYRSNSALTSSYNEALSKTLADHPVWVQSSFIPAADLPKLTHDPEPLRKYKTDKLGLGVAFPHPIQTVEAMTYTPFGNGLVIGFAERLIETEHLGSNTNTPDILFVGLSSPDYLGHYYGPDSLEVADSCVRTDRDIAGFLAWLDQRFKDRYTVAITADHGVQSIPEVARDLGRDAGRVNLAPKGDARAEANRVASAALGATESQSLIAAFTEPSIYLDWKTIAANGYDGERVKRAVRDAVLKIQGVSGAWTNSELLIPNASPSDLELAIRRSFRADRSGDVLLTLKRGYVFGSGATAATHGQPVEEDQHVPVMLWGSGVRPQKYSARVAPTDLAKSLGSLFGVDAGGADTRILPAFSTGDLQAVLRAAVQITPHYEHLLAGERLSPAARTAIALESPTAETESLPEGYARLDRAEIEGDTATVTFWYGPIPKPRPGELLMACGSGHTYIFKRDETGSWTLANQSVTVC